MVSMVDVKFLDLVRVDWVDAARSGENRLLKDFPEVKAFKSSSVGWIVYENDEVVVLASTTAYNGNRVEGTEFVSIPRVSIRAIADLTGTERWK